MPRRAWTALKWVLCLAVLAFVARRAYQLWTRQELAAIEFSAVWLVPSALVYLVGWLPAVTVWRRLMRRLGAEVRTFDAVRAHYCGHLGKYVPGKALVVVIRSGLLRDRGAPLLVSGLAAAYETLLLMSAGLAVGVALAPLLASPERAASWPEWARQIIAVPVLPVVLVIAATAALLPVISQLLTLFAVQMTPRGMSQGDRAVRIGRRTVAASLAILAAGWSIHGLSLGLVLHALGVPFDAGQWPLWTGAAALATSLGFVAVFAPGGIGVREGLLIEFLSAQPGIAPQIAVAAAVLLRIVWFAAEIIAAGALYWMRGPGMTNDEARMTKE
jgi:glycosyltransferase 2 family protein